MNRNRRIISTIIAVILVACMVMGVAAAGLSAMH